jgi:hypothetical protein
MLSSLRLQTVPSWVEKMKKAAEFEKPIVVHIRRGDYIDIPELGFLPIEYFEKAMRQELALNPMSRFWIFSDDFEYVKQELSIDLLSNSRLIENEPENAAAHLELMRHGYSYVISNSTFSWWGAFLSYNRDARVTCPRDWFATKKNPLLLLPQNWIKFGPTEDK